MNRSIAFLFLLLLLATSCRKDRLHWRSVQQLQSHTESQLNRIFFLSDTIGFVIGGVRYLNATILRTNDGGYTWTAGDYPEAGKILNGICKSPAGVLYTCGIDGRLLISRDSGLSWQNAQYPIWESFKAIAFPQNDTGVMAGGISYEVGQNEIIKSDGGFIAHTDLRYELNDICFETDKIGFECGYGVVLKSTDGGLSWNLLDINSDNFKRIQVLGIGDIWLCGSEGFIYHSTDDGNSWTCLRNGNDVTIPKYHLYDILMLNDLQGYCAGEKGVVIYTDDGGRHWMEVDPFTSANLRSIALCANGDLLVCGEGGELWRMSQ